MSGSLDPKYWGPIVWKTIFIFTINYPIKNSDTVVRTNYHRFYTSLQSCLPCTACQKGYQQYMQQYPINDSLTGVKDLLVWLLRLYNQSRSPKDRIRNLKQICVSNSKSTNSYTPS